MQRIYDVIMKTRLGDRKGRFYLDCGHSTATGSLHILGHKNPVHGTVVNNSQLALRGELITLMRIIPFLAQGYADEKSTSLTLYCPSNTFYIIGTAVQGE